jgi:hypothetical protein
MIILATTSDSLELVTSAAGSIDYSVHYADHTTSSATAGASVGNVATATTTTVAAAPAASTQRQVREVTIRNAGSAANIVTVQIDPTGTVRTLVQATLSAGETLLYSAGQGWYSLDSVGRLRTTVATVSQTGYAIGVQKVGATMEAIGVLHSHHAATGTPGAWAPGTPGVAGRATDGTTAADAGTLPIRTAAGGLSSYLTTFTAAGSVAASFMVVDILWVNTGVVVTTTTAQTITSVTFPARDIDGATAGNGVQLGILVTTATTNAAAITNTTAVYTNSGGTTTRTATMTSFPATAIAGTLVPFNLADGDKGVRSVQSVTLGTSRGGGAISLVAYRVLGMVGCPVANVAASALLPGAGVRVHAGVAAVLVQIPTATTATTVTAALQVVEA